MITWTRTQVGSLFSETIPGEWGSDPVFGAVPVLRSTNLEKDGELDLGKIVYRSVPKSKLASRRITQGNILIEKSGGGPGQPAGRVGFVREPFEGTCSNFLELCKVRPEIDPAFAFYTMLNLYQQGRVVKYQQQTTGIINFKLDQYKSEPIHIPDDQSVQSLIAATIDQVREQIRLLEQVIAKQERVRAGLLQALLTRGIDENGEIRDPVQSAFEKSPVGNVPCGWDVQPLDSIIESAVDGPFGSNLKSSHYVSSPGVRVIRLQNLGVNAFKNSDQAYISELHAESLARHRCSGGDILIAAMGDDRNPIGRACLYPEGEPFAIVKADCFRLRLQPKKALHGFAVLYLNSFMVRRQLELLRQGVTRDRVNLSKVRQLLVAIPDVNEQARISELNRASTAQIIAIEEELAKLRRVKTGLMRDLLSGEVSVEPLLDLSPFSFQKMEKP